MSVRVLVGDCRERLREIDAGSIQTCVTSPPYWGLRDYGCDGQIGLEKTPDEYVAQLVAVFREVRRALRDDGTLWLNLGDSYAGQPGGFQGKNGDRATRTFTAVSVLDKRSRGLKPKDLVGIPWAVARALRDPYYTGKIQSERDRAWIAAMIDGEGTICGFEHERADGGGVRSGVNLCITNTSTLLLDEAARIWPASRSEHTLPSDGHLGTLPCHRWIVHGAENKSLFLREVYPYLVAKRTQALLAYNLAELMVDAKRLGHSPQRDAVREKRSALVRLMSDANHARAVDVPSWCVEPPDATEPGWYLRSDIIWAKPNPMPESVTDRPTKAHEYVFLLSKSERYYYDAKAIAESATGRAPGNTGPHKYADAYASGKKEHRTAGGLERIRDGVEFRNKRTVWTVASEPCAEAHFAVMPSALVVPCVLAGSRIGDTVLDPFGGSGTTARVAEELGRNAVLCELNAEYAKIIERRTAQAGLFAKAAP